MQATKSQQYCGTCTYWGGDRSVRVKTAEFESQEKGKCYHPSGSWKNQDRQATASCPKHQVWGPLT